MKKDYSDRYPEGFFNLFGSITDDSFAIPEDIVDEDEYQSIQF